MTFFASAGSDRGKPQWTTGQALGFLLAVPGAVVIIAACVAAMVTAGLEDPDDVNLALLLCGAGAVLGLVMALLGVFVYKRCARQ